MIPFFRFPHTPHLAWLGPGKPRDDKVLSPDEVAGFLSAALVVEEKVDGANLGFSVNEDGELRAQNRGAYLDIESPHGQWKPLKRWLVPRRTALAEALFPELVLFGEWCHAVHSVRYSRLPDLFLAFDVYDRERDEFWSAGRRDELAMSLGLAVVPRLATGAFTMERLRRLLTQSQIGEGPAEGLYLRCEEGDLTLARAKLVRPEFVQAIGEHWSKRALEANTLAVG